MHRKTQTPIAFTQAKMELGYCHNHLVERALLPSLKRLWRKGYNIPIKTKIPLILIFSLCSIFIIPHFLRVVNKFDIVYLITFRKVEKAFLCTREAFLLFIYTLSIVLTSTPFSLRRSAFDRCDLSGESIYQYLLH